MYIRKILAPRSNRLSVTDLFICSIVLFGSAASDEP
jgi:hypothetical protein